MSMFLPEGTNQGQQQSGVSSITPANPETTADDIALMQRVLSAASRNPNLIPSDFMAYLFDFIQTQRLQIPIGQVFGFSQFNAQTGVVVTSENRTSSAFGDLATVGPRIQGLAEGHFLVLWGAAAAGSPAVSIAEMIVQDGAGNPTDHSLIAETSVGSATSVMAVDTITLSNSNTLITKYASSDNTFSCSWINRFIIALRYGNL